ncbi:MAG: DUF4136 domain-containing protein [Akkermansiaceae bacterium]
MLKNALCFLSVVSCLGFVSCTSTGGVDMPKGTGKGYTAARLPVLDPNYTVPTSAREDQVHKMIQNSLKANFKANGMGFGQSNSDLIVAYMVIYQELGMTTRSTKYFGNNADTERIAEVAHLKGAVDTGRPDFFQQAGIIVDVMDARTNKLIYRNVAKGDVVKGVSDSTRAQRINGAVTQALAPFFRK